MYKTKPCAPCAMPNPDATKHMAKNLARNTLYYAQLLKERPLVPEVAAVHG